MLGRDPSQEVEYKCSLHGDETAELERFQISPASYIVMRRLDVRWQTVFILPNRRRLGEIGEHRRARLGGCQRGRGPQLSIAEIIVQ
jgi:hypothetical protein